MQLLLLIVVAAALLMADAAADESAGHVWAAALLVAGSALVVPAMAWLGTRRFVKRLRAIDLAASESEFPRVLRTYEQFRRWLVFSWAAIMLGSYAVAGWTQVVRHDWGLAAWVLVDELLILLPLLGSLVLVWCVFYTGEYAYQRASAIARGDEMPPERRGSYVMLLVRHYFGLCLLPVLAVTAANDIGSVLATAGPGIPDWLIFGPVLLILMVCFPWLLCFVWRTSPLPAGELRQTLEQIASSAGLKFREIHIWHTGNLMMNAAVAGFLPRWRYVFLTDGLLARLSPQEIAAAFAHEVGHVRRRHLMMRLLILMAPAGLWMLLSMRTPGMMQGVADWLAGLSGISPTTQMGVLAPAVLILYVAIALGWFSRLLEHEADLWAAGLARGAEGNTNVVDFVSALERLTIFSGTDRRRGGWLHPSIEKRVAFLRSAAHSPHIADHFQGRVARVFATWMATTVLAALIVSLLP